MTMETQPSITATDVGPTWPAEVYTALRQAAVGHFCYVPDAGHAALIRMAHADPVVHSTVLTSEQEGIALVAGAWLGGQRGVLLMQSSGVGNCINMLSLVETCRFPLLTLVTMRGEWAEFNPWQVPMGRATPAVLAQMGVTVLRVDHAGEAAEVVAAAAALAFDGDQQVAVLLSQRMLGRKTWVGRKTGVARKTGVGGK